MVQDVRSSTTDVVLDLSSETGIINALSLVRNSQLTIVEKRELRDLIFLYTSTGGDPALRTLIEDRLYVLTGVPKKVEENNTLNDNVVSVTVGNDSFVSSAGESNVDSSSIDVITSDSASNTNETKVIGHTRPAPRFVPVTIREELPNEINSETEEDVTEQNQHSSEHKEDNYTELSTDNILAHVMPAPVLDPEPVPQAPKALVDEVLAPVAPQSEPTVEYKPPYREDGSLDKHRTRIAEIKQMINTKIGNPVNLVDLSNDIGRAYMTALLEAMKAVSGGGGDADESMSKLEAVVTEVEKLLHKVDTENEAKTVPELDVAGEVSPATEKEAVDEAVSESVISEGVSSQSEGGQLKVVEAVVPVVKTETKTSTIPVANMDMVSISPMTIASSRFKNVIPVAAQEPLKTPADLPTAAELKARSGITDPLEDPDVDLGLEQLLSEWSLFKKSGMFGTGPKGRQHPLFIKLSGLSMPLILSGRFEGATNEIRQSVTDYMNGWRYEQGIIYDAEETFEHYLRRVIRHIIDSQTRRRGA